MRWKVFELVLEAFTLGYASVTVLLFLIAYFNGYAVTLTINDFGEAKAEFIIFFVFAGLLLSNFYLKVIVMLKYESKLEAQQE